MNENNFNEYPENSDGKADGFAPEVRDGFSDKVTAPDGEGRYADAENYRAEDVKKETETPDPTATYNPYVASSASGGYYYSRNSYQPPYGAAPQQTPSAPAPAEPAPSGKKGGNVLMWVLIAICVVVAGTGLAIGFMNYDTVAPDTNTTGETTTAAGGQNQDNSENGGKVDGSVGVSTTNPDKSVPNSIYVADKVRPSVVGVMTYMNGKLYGEGSGVLMSEKDGWTYVVTCAHVISDRGVEFAILLLDGTTISAELVAYDERTDIGVVKVNKTGLPLAEFGDSTTLKVGEPIYAIGNPGGSEYFGSITDGIVSAIDRSVTSKYTMTCIQHNAAINPGNSGGALVNSAGQIIGINSSKIASTEFEGMGFAVPTSIAIPVVDALIDHGYVPNRPKLGIEYAPVSEYQLYSLIVSIKGLPQGSLVIAGIAEDSSLKDTDVQEGDLITAVNGKKMDNSSVLLDLIETGAVGDTLTLTICRIESRTYKVTEFDVTITLVEDRGSVPSDDEETTSQPGFFDDYFGW